MYARLGGIAATPCFLELRNAETFRGQSSSTSRHIPLAGERTWETSRPRTQTGKSRRSRSVSSACSTQGPARPWGAFDEAELETSGGRVFICGAERFIETIRSGLEGCTSMHRGHSPEIEVDLLDYASGTMGHGGPPRMASDRRRAALIVPWVWPLFRELSQDRWRVADRDPQADAAALRA